MQLTARILGEAVRRGDRRALAFVELALVESRGSVSNAARVLGLAGASSLWRWAYASPEVRQLIADYGRRRGGISARRRHWRGRVLR